MQENSQDYQFCIKVALDNAGKDIIYKLESDYENKFIENNSIFLNNIWTNKKEALLNNNNIIHNQEIKNLRKKLDMIILNNQKILRKNY